jgi:hypothetical protein
MFAILHAFGMFVVDLFKSRFRGTLLVDLQLMRETNSRKPPFLTNDTPQPNKNKRDRTSSNATLIVRFSGFSGEGVPLITVCLHYPWCLADLENGSIRTEQTGVVNSLTNTLFLASCSGGI